MISSVLQGAGVTSSKASQTGQSGQTSQTSSTSVSDNSQLSPFAQLLTTLQQLQQTNPTEYQQVTQQIATNLQGAAQTATSQGNTTAASQLTQLSTDFSNASQNNQLPNIQDLASAIGGGHHHHGHHAHAASDADSSSSSSSTSTTSSTNSTTSDQTLSQLLSAFQNNSTQSDSLNPMSIIMNTLSNAGITTSGS
jgi:hypothetical protein